MAADLFMRVEEVAEVMGVSVSYAYKIIRQFNKELKKTGWANWSVNSWSLREQKT